MQITSNVSKIYMSKILVINICLAMVFSTTVIISDKTSAEIVTGSEQSMPEMPPYPPYTVYGILSGGDEESVSDGSVIITNQNTGESLDADVYENGAYEAILEDLPSGYTVGDSIEISVISGSFTTDKTIVVEQMGFGKRVDFNLGDNEKVASSENVLASSNKIQNNPLKSTIIGDEASSSLNTWPERMTENPDPIIIDSIGTTDSSTDEEPDIVLVDIRAPPGYRYALDDQRTMVNLTLGNIGDVRYIVIAELTNIKPSGQEEYIDTLTFGAIMPGHEKTKRTFWTPDTIGENYIKIDIKIREKCEIIPLTSYEASFYVVPSENVLYWYSKEINEPQEFYDMTIISFGDLVINADTVFDNCTLVIDPIRQNVTINADSTWKGPDGIYLMDTQVDGATWINVTQDGVFNIILGGHVTTTDTTTPKRYQFTVNGALNIDSSTVEYVWGNTTDLSQPGGIQCYGTNNVNITGNSVIRNGATHGIWLDNSDAVIRDSFIYDNGADGIAVVEGSAPQIEGNEITWNERYGINIDNSTPIIRNNPLIQYNGIHGIYINDVWNETAKIEANTIKDNMASGIYASDTNITIASNTISSNGLDPVFEDDFEIDTGWTADGLWHRVNNESGAGDPWNLSHSGDWSYWYGQDATGDYDNGTHNWGNLTSTTIDITNATSAALTFWSWYETDTTTDQRWVIIRNDSVPDVSVQLVGGEMNAWTRYIVNISDFVGMNITVTFYFDTWDDLDNANQGWYIDDVEVITAYPVLEGHGIFLEGQTPSLLFNNTISENNWHGIYSRYNSQALIDSNKISANRNTGIYLDTSSATTISNNTISDNGENGIYLINSAQTINSMINSGSEQISAGSTMAMGTYNDDAVLLKLKPAYRYGASYMQTMSDIESDVGANLIKNFQYSGILKLKLDSGTTVNNVLEKLSVDSRVQYAEPDYLVSMAKTPNDPGFNSLWGLNNIGQTGGTIDADIDAPDAWNITTGSKDIVVAVIDTGINYTHEDLADNMWTNPNEMIGDANNDGYPGVQGVDDDSDGLIDEDGAGRVPSDPNYNWNYANDDDENGYIDDIYGINAITGSGDPMDDNGHGTHVAGTIGAVGNNSIGVTGVNWNVSIMALKFLGSGGFGSTSDAIESLEYVLTMKKDHGVNITVASNSWGGGAYSQTLYEAIADLRDADILFTAAAMNDGSNNDYFPVYPSTYNLTNIISVAATDHNDELALFSNYGAGTVDVAAPGTNINSTVPQDIADFYGLPYPYYLLNGTSMATPYVSGLIALIASTDSSYNYVNLKNLIMTSVDYIPSLSNKMVTEGRINAYSALNYSPNGMHLLVHSPGNDSKVLKDTPVEVVVSVSDGLQPITNAFINVTFSSGDPLISLLDDGFGVDQVAGDGYYSGLWTPQQEGVAVLNISASADSYENVSKEIYVFVVSSGNIITGNMFTNNWHGLMLYFSNTNTIASNSFSNNRHSIYLYRSSNNTITNNTASENYCGIYLVTSRGNTIKDNTVSFASITKYGGISLTVHSSGNTIDNNNVSNSFYGICLRYASGNTIINNIALDNSAGISIYGSESNIITNNTASNNSRGIWLSTDSNVNTITNNYFSSNTRHGIYLGNSDKNKIETNIVSNNNKSIYLYMSNNNTIDNCTISSNDYGIYLNSSSNNLVINTTISNSTQYDFYLDADSHATALNTTFNKTKVFFNDALSTLTVQWFLDVKVVDENYAPVLNTSIWVNDTFGSEVMNSTTPDGRIRWIHATEYVQNSTNTTYYTHNITASNATLTGWAMPEPFMDRNKEVYVLLGPGKGYNIFLHEGWNFVSVPYQPFNMSSDNLLTVLTTIDGKYDFVQWYDSTDSLDHWKTYNVNSAATPELTHLNHTMGFWINILEDCTLFSIGERISPVNITLHEGWNMVGYPTENRTTNISTAFAGITSNIDSIEAYNETAEYNMSPVSGDYIMRPGDAYWVYVNATDVVWTVDW